MLGQQLNTILRLKTNGKNKCCVRKTGLFYNACTPIEDTEHCQSPASDLGHVVISGLAPETNLIA